MALEQVPKLSSVEIEEVRDAEEADRDSDDEAKNSEDEEAEEEARLAKTRKYLEFKRNFDQMKAMVKGKMSEAQTLKEQGNNFYSFGCYSQATFFYTEAIELDPHNEVLYCNRAMSYLKQDMPVEALADADTSLSINADVKNIKGHWRKSQALLDLGLYENAEEAADLGLELQPANKHINQVRKKAREAIITRKLIGGQSGCEWRGKMSNGVEQILAFREDGTMTMTVFGHSVEATYELSVEGRPRSMLVKMDPKVVGTGNGPPPPPVPYIFQFESDEELWVCLPVPDVSPDEFKGPGFTSLTRQPLSTAVVPVDALDVRTFRYMRSMNELMPLLPVQLPEDPSEAMMNAEIDLTNKMAVLRKTEGLDAHRRAVELAKNPDAAGTPEAVTQARDLRRRFLSRKLIPTEIVITTFEDHEAAEEPAPAASSEPAGAPQLEKGFLDKAKGSLYGKDGSAQGKVADETARFHKEQRRGAEATWADDVDKQKVDQLLKMKVNALLPEHGEHYLAETEEEAVTALRQANWDMQVAAGLLLRGSARMNPEEVSPEEKEAQIQKLLDESRRDALPKEEEPQEEKAEEGEQQQEMQSALETIQAPSQADMVLPEGVQKWLQEKRAKEQVEAEAARKAAAEKKAKAQEGCAGCLSGLLGGGDSQPQASSSFAP